MQSVHEGKKFQCPHCEHKATQKGSLQRHIKSVHEGQRSPCMHCQYKATDKWDLKKHIQSVHEGRKYPCTHCQYKATTKGSLQRHMKSIHIHVWKSSNVACVSALHTTKSWSSPVATFICIWWASARQQRHKLSRMSSPQSAVKC